MRTKRIAVVTGANRGIGAEIARQLVLADFDVVGTSREAQDGRAVTAVGARHIVVDVTDHAGVENLARELEGGIDVLMNNAGVSMQGFDEDVARRTLDVNFFGALRVTDAFLPRMHPGGRIVMVSSGMGELSSVSEALKKRFLNSALGRAELVEMMRSFVADVAAGTYREKGWPGSAYRVSKIGLNTLTRILSRELTSDPRGILVNAVCPGWVRTSMGGPSAPRSPEKGAETPVWAALLPQGGPSGRFFRDRQEIGW